MSWLAVFENEPERFWQSVRECHEHASIAEEPEDDREYLAVLHTWYADYGHADLALGAVAGPIAAQLRPTREGLAPVYIGESIGKCDKYCVTHEGKLTGRQVKEYLVSILSKGGAVERVEMKSVTETRSPSRRLSWAAMWLPLDRQGGSSYLRVLIAVARADGALTKGEKAFLNEAVSWFHVTTTHFRDLCRRPPIFRLADLPDSAADRETLLAAACALAIADGEVSPEEQAIIEKLAKGMSLDSSVVDQCFARVRKARSDDCRSD